MADEKANVPKPGKTPLSGESESDIASAIRDMESAVDRATKAAEAAESAAKAAERGADEAAEAAEDVAEATREDGLFSSEARDADIVIDGRRQSHGFSWRNAEPWQRRRMTSSFLIVAILAAVYIIVTCVILYSDKEAENDYWDYYLNEQSPEMVQAVQEFSKDATHVQCAVYLDQVTKVDIKGSQFAVDMQIGYLWEGDDEFDFTSPDVVHFYKGSFSASERTHIDRGDLHYSRVAYNVTINKTFWTPRFPLDSHQMRIYLEPSANVNSIVLEPVEKDSGFNTSSSITGYDMTRFAVTENIITYDTILLNPEYAEYKNPIYKTELLTMFEINREGFGLYIKCCVALYGTLAWILLCLYIATFRRVDALGMVGSAFFGAVSNVLVGANLLPDALQLGLIEFVNFFGVAIIVAGAAVVIAINTIRKERGNEAFAQFYGRVMLGLFIVIVIVGNIALPLSAYMFVPGAV